MSISYKIIVARYNEDVSWFESEKDNCIIYNKGDSLGIENEIMRENIGRESETYLHYIITNYDSLPDVVCFTQANISDHSFHRGKNDINYLLELIEQAKHNGKSNECIHQETTCDHYHWCNHNWNQLLDGTFFLKDNSMFMAKK